MYRIIDGKCPVCEGAGWIRLREEKDPGDDAVFGYNEQRAECPLCNGSGRYTLQKENKD